MKTMKEDNNGRRKRTGRGRERTTRRQTAVGSAERWEAQSQSDLKKAEGERKRKI